VAVFIPVSGWAADRFGGRTIFRAAIGLFTLGSVLCGLSNNAIELTAARVLQGLGGAMMVPVGRLVLFRSVERSQLVRTMAYLQVPAQLGPVLGPPVGGFITTYFSWRWIFLINVPLGLLGILLVTLFFDNPKEDDPRPLDWLGFLLTGVSLAGILYGIEAIGRGFNLPSAVALLIGGFITGFFALRHLRRTEHPLLNLSIFRIPTFRASIGGGSLFRAGAGSLVFLLPLLLQVVLGMSAFASGLITFATAVGSMSMKATARPILKRFGFRNVMIVNGMISAASIAMCAFFTGATPVPLIFVLLLIAGFFQSLQFTATQAVGYADISNPQMSTATSIASMAQQLSRGFGVATVALLLHFSLAWRGASALGLIDFRIAFAGATALVLGCLPFCLPLAADAAAEVSGHRPNSV
jgi:EmrB/QacA subfamily drug resistance transporter